MSPTGARRSENVGTSNHKFGEIPNHRKPKVSLAMLIIQGLVGPKAMAKAVADGQQVNIPAPRYFFDGATEDKSKSRLLDFGCWYQDVFSWQIRKTALMQTSRIDKIFPKGERFLRRASQEKLLELRISSPYRKPTQVGEASSLR